MEKWDAYLANGQKTGRILTRGQSIPDDLYHLAVDCLVQHVDNDILFVQRHLRMTRQTTLLHSSTKSRLRAQTSFSCRFTTHRHRLSSHRQRRCSMSRSSSVLTVWMVS